MRFIICLVFILALLPACSYRVGYYKRGLPQSYAHIAIPTFSNETPEVGIEVYFTNQLRQEFNQSKIARVTDKAMAQVTLHGHVISVRYDQAGGYLNASSGNKKDRAFLPNDTSLVKQYRVIVTVGLDLKRNSDSRVIWEGTVTDEILYNAPQLTIARVNTANPLYNHSARHENIAKLARDMMSEAHDRMTEKF